MFELFENNPAVEVQEVEYKRLLGYPADYELNGRSRDLADWARDWYANNGTPWMYARQAMRIDASNEMLQIEGRKFSSAWLQGRTIEASAELMMLAAVSAGGECEEKARRLWSDAKPDEYFFLEVYSSAVVEHLIASLGHRLCEWADSHQFTVFPHYSPGYPEWSILEQASLLNLIKESATTDVRHRLRVLDSGMLVPRKSQLAAFGVTRHRREAFSLVNAIPCQSCSLPACRYRRVPYARILPRLDGGITRSVNPASPLQADAAYSVSAKALYKWSEERLRLRLLNDRTTEAQFRYDGTTCTNMGHPLQFEYYVRVSSPETGFTILEARCKPVPDHQGYKSMCAYIASAEAWRNSLSTEQPLLGKPLKEVLSWQRSFAPSGCFCTAESRNHKWGLALEVLHYALVERGI